MRPYRIGDFVEINGLDGEVTDLDLFFTQIQTLDDKRVFVPNSQAVSNPIVNFSREGVRRCIIPRSEEHTSELQSLMRISYAVFCLKKKKNKKNKSQHDQDSNTPRTTPCHRQLKQDTRITHTQ